MSNREQRIVAAAKAMGFVDEYFESSTAALAAADAVSLSPDVVARAAQEVDAFTESQFGCVVTFEARDDLVRAIAAVLFGTSE